jgi:hypothetical protein
MVRTGFFAALALGLGGCHSCANDHPYVPADSDASTAGVTDAAAATPAVDAGLEPALTLAPGTTTWKGAGLSIDGSGREIALVLARDFDGDGKQDALAILRPVAEERKPASLTGQVVFVHGGASVPAVIAMGPTLGQWPACIATARLEKVGAKSAFAEIGSNCPKAVGERKIFILRLGPVPTIAFDATVQDPKDAGNLTINVDTADRDKDGLDDITLHLNLDGLEAKLAFYDRPAGPSRDPEEPEASLHAIAQRISAKATKTKEMPALVEQLRMLYRAMCEEGGAPRITGIHGAAATSCGPSKSLEDAGIAEVRALAGSGDPFSAFFAADIAQAAPATKTAARTKELEKYLAEAAAPADAKTVKTLGVAVDIPLDAQPQWGPLSFEASGKLLVRKGKTATRVDPDNGEELPGDMPAWPSEVLSPDGKRRWIEAYQACEGTAFRASFAILDNDGMVEASLPFAPRLGRGCTGHGDPVLAQPLTWGAHGLEAVIAGHLVQIKDEPPVGAIITTPGEDPPPLGSPRSHNGKAIAAAISNALLVRADDKWTNLKSSDVRSSDLRACTIDDAATRVACVRQGKVVVLAR